MGTEQESIFASRIVPFSLCSMWDNALCEVSTCADALGSAGKQQAQFTSAAY